ncbi:MAG: hypothetical protein U0531_04395 [Dehalococcoidia bacterium]
MRRRSPALRSAGQPAAADRAGGGGSSCCRRRRLLARLGRRLTLLTGGPRDLPARQQGAPPSTIDWSYHLLRPGEAVLFARLAVFVGGCDLESVEAVCNAEADLAPDVLDSLTLLVDKSLVRRTEGPEGEPRFGMLGPSANMPSNASKAAATPRQLRRRHAEHYLALAEQAAPELRGPRQGAWLVGRAANMDNLRAALAWANAQAATAIMIA